MQQIVSLLVPLLLIIALGFLAGKFKILPPETGHVLTQYLFYFSVPCLSFSNIYQSNIQVLLNPNILLTFFCTIVTVILLQGLLYTRVFHIRGQELVMLTLGGFYMNAIYMGVPVTTANGEYPRVEGLPVDEFSRAAMDKTLAELEEERAGVAHLL